MLCELRKSVSHSQDLNKQVWQEVDAEQPKLVVEKRHGLILKSRLLEQRSKWERVPVPSLFDKDVPAEQPAVSALVDAVPKTRKELYK